INGKACVGEKGDTILNVARKNGVYIPTLCHDDRLKPVGACRTCIGEIDGVRNLQSTCTYPAAEGMVVNTENTRVQNVRKVVCELLVADHPKDLCTHKDEQPRENELLTVAKHSGLEREGAIQSRFRSKKESSSRKDSSHPFITFDDASCINCFRCIRGCDEVQGENVLTMAGRGFGAFIANDINKSYLDSTCVSCGQCVQQCPTGALEDKTLKISGGWDKEVKTTCAYCGTGCSMVARVKEETNEVVSIRGNFNSPVNYGHLCVKGRYAYSYGTHKERLQFPLIRETRDKPFRRATWDEAVNLITSEITRIRGKYGASALGGISTSRGTNEENYIFMKFFRQIVGTNNVDNCSRVCHSPTAYGLREAFGESAGTGGYEDIEKAKCLLIIGSNPTEGHPILGDRIRQAARRGATMIVIDPRRTQTAREADLHLPVRPGGNVAIINAIAHVCIKEGFIDEAFITARTKNYEQLAAVLEKYSPENVEALTGVSPELIRKAARIYGATRGQSVIHYGLGVTEHKNGSDGVLSIANLASITGNVGKPGAAVIPMRGQNNVQGSSDMGALPVTLTEYQKHTDPVVRELFKKVWGAELPTDKGLKIPEMFDAAIDGKLKFFWVVGEDLLQSDPDSNKVEAAMDNMEFIVGQDLFLNETNKKAHVILPAASFLEKDGTFTNAERRIQRIRKAINPPGECLSDFDIVQRIANAMGAKWNYTPASIVTEIAKVTKCWAGVTYERLEETEGMQWPVYDANHPGSPRLHTEKAANKDGLIKLHPLEYHPPGDELNEEYPWELTTGRKLEQYNVGTQTRRTGIAVYDTEDRLEIHPEDAKRMGILEDDWIEITSRRDSIRLRAQVTHRIREGTVFTTFHFPETALNRITSEHKDGPTMCPEYKFTAVRLVRVGGAGEPALKHHHGEVPMTSDTPGDRARTGVKVSDDAIASHK
ncbi:MAG: formate dehydrogenase subunit alpha, partial [Planctomycetes bacterium]|nr:formate dehydrogenase subunit alpha [Planctomycetota bacterium]